jgi:prepilin-type N-terminal cleavage/methylation domain-containing protein
MLPIALRDKRGVSLVEVMIALVVLLIVFMGLMQASIVAIQANMRNILRDEAVRTTANVMAQLRSAPIDDIERNGVADPNPLNFNWDQDGTANGVHTVQVRNTPIPFTIAVNVVPVGDHKQLAITTTWAWQGESFTHSLSALRRRS